MDEESIASPGIQQILFAADTVFAASTTRTTAHAFAARTKFLTLTAHREHAKSERVEVPERVSLAEHHAITGRPGEDKRDNTGYPED